MFNLKREVQEFGFTSFFGLVKFVFGSERVNTGRIAFVFVTKHFLQVFHIQFSKCIYILQKN